MDVMFYVWLALVVAGVASEVFLGVVGWGLVLTAGAMAGTVAAAAGYGLTVQLMAAAVVALAIAPFIIRAMQRFNAASGGSPLLSEGAGRGKVYTVTAASGRLGVKIEGDFFPAESASTTLREGQRVRYLGMSGITAQVEPVEETSPAPPTNA